MQRVNAQTNKQTNEDTEYFGGDGGGGGGGGGGGVDVVATETDIQILSVLFYFILFLFFSFFNPEPLAPVCLLEALDGQPLPVSSAGLDFHSDASFSSFSLFCLISLNYNINV